jgi:multimeric flavodoxin WrbA
MKVIGINCSPRKKFNTSQVLERALQGAEAKGAWTKFVNLYDYTFQGCTGCLACKLLQNKDNGLCVMQDSITPLLAEMARAGALIIGSPIYFGDVSAYARAIIERFAYPFFLYSREKETKYTGNMKTAFIYTMNIDEENMTAKNYRHVFDNNQLYFTRLFGHAEYLTVCDTMQVNDYSKYLADKVDPEAKRKARAEKFPRDLERAYSLGAALAG